MSKITSDAFILDVPVSAVSAVSTVRDHPTQHRAEQLRRHDLGGRSEVEHAQSRGPCAIRSAETAAPSVSCSISGSVRGIGEIVMSAR